MDITLRLVEELGLEKRKIEAAVKLIIEKK